MYNKKFFFLIVLLCSIFLSNNNVLAAKVDSSEIINDNYHYQSNDGKDIIDNFEYKDEYFTESSFYGNKGLEILSIQLASASVSHYSLGDSYEINNEVNNKNVLDMLQKMNFNNILFNKYYSEEKKENSVGVAVAKKTIIHDNKPYTLLAVIPRSAGYKEEWAGNFTIGAGDIHDGFKQARDEILRFVKKYIQDNNIEGDLKIWTVGYSRGAAIADMIGGFFAGGGIEYFGDNVRLTPEDVYGYTIGTPRTIKNGLSKNTELSVSANRNDARYSNDTKMDAYNYTKGGSVLVGDSIYKGLRNIISSDDIFPLLPFEDWKFTHYGQMIDSNLGIENYKDVLNKIKQLNSDVYESYTENNEKKIIKRKTFDLSSLKIIDSQGTTTPSKYFMERFKRIKDEIKTNKIYNDEYQKVLSEFFGAFGMFVPLVYSESSNIDTNALIEPLIFTYFAYASEQLQSDGKANNDTEAVTIAIEEILSYFTHEDIDRSNFTVDDFLKLITKYFAEHEDSEFANAIVKGIVDIVPKEYASFLGAFKSFAKGDSSKASIEDGIKSYLKACYLGADPESEHGEDFSDPKEVRNSFFLTISLVASQYVPEVIDVLRDDVNEYQFTGAGSFEDLINVLLNYLESKKDDEGNSIKIYNNISEFADAKLVDLMDKILGNLIIKSESIYSTEYKNSLEGHINVVKNDISKVRKIFSSFMFSTDKGFDVKDTVESISTVVDNIKTMVLAHYNEIYLSESRVANRYEKFECIEGNNQAFNLENDNNLTFRFNFDYNEFVSKGKVYVDFEEVSIDNYKLSSGSTIITFNDEYINNLNVGKHILMLEINGRKAKTEFNIKENNEEDENIASPNTSDNILNSITMLIGSTVSLIFIVKINYEKKKIAF